MSQPENDDVLWELDKGDLIRLLKEKDQVIRGFDQKGLDPEVKEMWAAINRLKDRIDGFEQSLARAATTLNNEIKYMHEVVDGLTSGGWMA